MDLTPKPGKEYSLYEVTYMSRYAHALCNSLVEAKDTPTDIRIVAQQMCGYIDNFNKAIIYLRPTQLQQWVERFKAYSDQLTALLQRETQ